MNEQLHIQTHIHVKVKMTDKIFTFGKGPKKDMIAILRVIYEA